MKEILEKFKKEILNHEEAKNYTSLLGTIDLELYKIKQNEEIKKLNLKDHNLKIEIKTMEEFIEVQKLAFLLNCGWNYGSSKPCKILTDSYDDFPPTFIFLKKYITVAFKNDRNNFENAKNKQVSIEELKTIVDNI